MPDTNDQFRTLFVMIAFTTLLILYDVATYRWRGQSSTISVVSRKLFGTYYSIFVAFIFWLGVMVGHFRFPCGGN